MKTVTPSVGLWRSFARLSEISFDDVIGSFQCDTVQSVYEKGCSDHQGELVFNSKIGSLHLKLFERG